MFFLSFCIVPMGPEQVIRLASKKIHLAESIFDVKV